LYEHDCKPLLSSVFSAGNVALIEDKETDRQVRTNTQHLIQQQYLNVQGNTQHNDIQLN